MTLEQKIKSLLPEGDRFDVIAFELWGNIREGFDCNNLWHIARKTDAVGVLDAARGRWEVFKVNYHPRARVSDIQDASCSPDRALLEVDCIPFLEIRTSTP